MALIQSFAKHGVIGFMPFESGLSGFLYLLGHLITFSNWLADTSNILA